MRDVSSGGVIARVADDGLELVLVGREQPPRWTIPKGTPHRGETLEQAALREVREETGLEVQILEPLGEITYWFVVRGVRHHKTVHFYLLEAVGGDTADHDWEHDFVAWMPTVDAVKAMSFPNELSIVQRAIERAWARFWGAPAGTSSHPPPVPYGDRRRSP